MVLSLLNINKNQVTIYIFIGEDIGKTYWLVFHISDGLLSIYYSTADFTEGWNPQSGGPRCILRSYPLDVYIYILYI